MIKVTFQNLIRHELIGLHTKVSESHNKQIVGFRGRIIDETRNTLTLRKGDRQVIIPKDIVHLQIRFPKGKTIELDGKTIIAKPEDRIKVRMRGW